VNKDLLMSIASFAANPVLPVYEERSLPAKSTNCSLLVTTLSTELLSIKSTLNEKIAWEREDC
jgi:hypothetical protein